MCNQHLKLYIILITNISFILWFLFRTTKSGNLPNLSFVARKPEPLGTEFKNLVDGMTGALLWLEIQEGKERMRRKPYQELGSTAACVLRGTVGCGDFVSLLQNLDDVDADMPPSPKLFLGDSWFGSVNALTAIRCAGHHGCFMVKTSHSRTPKKFLDETMKDFPGGTWITLTSSLQKDGENIELVCIGYKYNKKSVLTFLTTRGAGKTIDGEPYEARFPDTYGNLCVRHVARPEVLSNYFNFSNVVDLHNQARQFDLKLEKKWITHDGYFRLYTTLVGMTVTDIWKIYKIGCPATSKLPIAQFADLLAADMISYANSLPHDSQMPPSVTVSTSSSSTSLSTMTTPWKQHTKVVTPERQSRCVWCSRVHLIERKTTLRCAECNKGFCRNTTGRDCWDKHVEIGCVPVAPKRGTKKRSVHDSEVVTM